MKPSNGRVVKKQYVYKYTPSGAHEPTLFMAVCNQHGVWELRDLKTGKVLPPEVLFVANRVSSAYEWCFVLEWLLGYIDYSPHPTVLAHFKNKFPDNILNDF